MKFKPEKSRLVTIIKGKFEHRHSFKINEMSITALSDKSIKSLGKLIDQSLRDSEVIKKKTNKGPGHMAHKNQVIATNQLQKLDLETYNFIKDIVAIINL